MTDYSYRDVSSAMSRLGIGPGDVLIMHSNIAEFGVPEGGLGSREVCSGFVKAIVDVIGPSGTLVLPTFSYSFGREKTEKIFDVEKTRSTCGSLTEYLRQQTQARRSVEPMLSVAAIGADAEVLTKDVSNICYGAGSVWERLLAARAKICNFNRDPGSTFIHYMESVLSVPYRRDIRMDGSCVIDGQSRPSHVIYTGRDLDDPDAVASRELYFAKVYEAGAARKTEIGKGYVSSISLEDTASVLERELRLDPWLLTVAGARAIAERAG
jgi:aminoglycoside 3-N-acetyltransferase